MGFYHLNIKMGKQPRHAARDKNGCILIGRSLKAIDIDKAS